MKEVIEIFSDSYAPAGTILAGQPVGFDDQLAASGERIKGIAKEDTDVTNATSSLIVLGRVTVIAGGSVTAGMLLQVGTGGKFVEAADGVPVGVAITDGGNNDEIAMYVGVAVGAGEPDEEEGGGD
jgi:hypothetical protein